MLAVGSSKSPNEHVVLFPIHSITPPASAVPSPQTRVIRHETIPEPKPEEKEEADVEAHKGDGKEDGELEDVKDVDAVTPKALEDGKDKPKDGLCINTASITSPTDKHRPGPLDLTSTRSASPIVAALATAHVIADIATVPYPEGLLKPHPDLNQNVKNGKFRYHY